MTSNLKVNTILPSTGDTVSIAGIASITSSVSIAGLTTHSEDVVFKTTNTATGGEAFWDYSDGSLRFNDKSKIKFGNGYDFQIYHHNNENIIGSLSGSHPIKIQTKVTGSTEDGIVIIPDGAVELYHDGSKRFETTTGGNKSIKTSANTFVIGSSDAGGAHIVLDGDSNGDGSGADYCGISHNTDGNMLIYQDNPNGNGQIDFQTGGANRVSMQSDKFRPWNNEGMTLGTTSLRWGNVYTSGIDFTHTSDATGKSNELLDDYEEGSWDPTLVFSNGNNAVSAFSWRTGKYTKVGNLVHCTFAMGLNGVNSGNTVRLAGIPFAPAGITYFYYFIIHGYNYASGYGDSNNTTRLFGEINATLGSQISIVYGSGRSTANSSHIGSTQRLTGMFHYYTA